MKKKIQLRMAQFLAAGVCLPAITGCNQSSVPKGEVTLAEMNQAVSMMSMHNQPPRTVDDLTNFPAFQGRRLLTPPDGKKLAFDPVSRQIVIVDK